MKKAPLLLLFVYACTTAPSSKPEPRPACKVVYSKREEIGTGYGHRYSWVRGEFVLVPKVSTRYLVIFQDGTSTQMDVGRWTLIEPGDTIKRMHPWTKCNGNN